MADTYDWSGFYLALCRLGPQLLVGIDDDVRQIIAMTAAEDTFWSDGLEDLLAHHAVDGDLRSGTMAAVELRRENVLTAPSESFGIDLNCAEVATPDDP